MKSTRRFAVTTRSTLRSQKNKTKKKKLPTLMKFQFALSRAQRLKRRRLPDRDPFHRLASAGDERQPRSGIRDVMWVKEPVQQLGTIAYDRPPVDAGPVTSHDAILGDANAITAAKNRDCGGARPSAQNDGLANEIARRTSPRCSNNNNSNNSCTFSTPFPDP